MWHWLLQLHLLPQQIPGKRTYHRLLLHQRHLWALLFSLLSQQLGPFQFPKPSHRLRSQMWRRLLRLHLLPGQLSGKRTYHRLLLHQRHLWVVLFTLLGHQPYAAAVRRWPGPSWPLRRFQLCVPGPAPPPPLRLRQGRRRGTRWSSAWFRWPWSNWIKNGRQVDPIN